MDANSANIQQIYQRTSIIMVVEGFPAQEETFLDLPPNSLFVQNTIKAFHDAGFQANDLQSVIDLGIYVIAAVKEPRLGDRIPSQLIKKYNASLEEELSRFVNLRAILLMGDTAISAINMIARRRYGKRCIPAGSTYKIRHGEYFIGKLHVFPSYLHTGKNYLIERSKQAMVADDIQRASKFSENYGAQQNM